MKAKLHHIPLWVINLVTVVSGIVTIITPVVTLLITLIEGSSPKLWWWLSVGVLCVFVLILLVRMRKYRDLADRRMKDTSYHFHKTSHDSRDVFFDILHSRNLKELTDNELNRIYKSQLSTILDYLCHIMKSFTEREVSACIKLISYSKTEETIDEENAELVTFCRSHNSVTDRNNYERRKPILLKDNTDFKDIISSENNKDYFYQGDLKQYDQDLKALGKRYENSNANWEKYYRGTVVVPIRIEFDKIYHTKRNPYHILGFVCVDSMHIDAFTTKQETYNVDVVKAFADHIYILLNQYRFYMKKLYEEKTRNDAGGSN